MYPAVAWRSCEDCQKWKYDEETGEVEMFGKVPLERPSPDLTPCRVTKAGCPKGTPERQRSLTPQNQQAWLYHRECRAVQKWPDDAVVRHNAAVIDMAEQAARDAKADRRMAELTEYIKLVLRAR